MTDTLLSVRDFSVVYDVDPPVAAVKNVTLEIGRGEIVGLAGESGCGKTTLAYGVQRLLKPPAVITSGSVTFHDASGADVDVNALDVEQMRRFRWDRISMVFQGAMNALNPVATIGAQLDDVFRVHRPAMSRTERRDAVVELRSDGGHRVEGVHGPLEDHRDLVPPESAHLLRVEGVDVDVGAGLVVEDDAAAGDHGRRLEQTLHAVRERGLAAAALAGETDDLAALDVEGDVLDRRDRRIHVVHDREVAHGKKGVCH